MGYSTPIYLQPTQLNSLPNDKSLTLTKLKAFADIKFNVAKMMIAIFDRVENIVGKKRKCWLPAFFSFPSMFSKALCFMVIKTWDYVVKG